MMLRQTRFQLSAWRFALGLYVTFISLSFLPQQITSANHAQSTFRWDFLVSPILKTFWINNLNAALFWYPLALLAVLSVFLHTKKIFSWLLLGVWMFEVNFATLQFDPSVLLISYSLFILSAYNIKDMPPIILKFFWLIFLIILFYDYTGVLNTVLDLFPFGVKYDRSYMPPLNAMYVRMATITFFFISLLFKELRLYGWLSLILLYFYWIALNGFTSYSGTMILTLLLLFNPHWTTTPSDPKVKPYIFFDGVCILCDRFIRFLLEEDFGRHFYFAPLQGHTAKEKLNRGQAAQLHSVIYLDEGKSYTKLDAIIMIFSEVGGMWVIIKILWLVPKFVRDFVYDFIANHRHQWFGTLNYCRFPTTEEKAYFRD